MLETLNAQHVNKVTEIHETSWSPDELSVKLGRGYLEAFYKCVVKSPHSFGFVYVDNTNVVGYATGFYNLNLFQKEFRNENIFHLGIILVKKFLIGEISISDIQNMFSDSHKTRKLTFPKHHLGALALANEFKGTDQGKIAIRSTINAVLDEFITKDFDGCWGVCDDRNIPMKKYLWKLGFSDIDEIQNKGRKVVVFEKEF